MSLINYIEPVSIGGMFTGIATLILALVLAYVLYKICKPLIGFCTILYNKESRYEIVESKVLNDIAMKKGIDLDKELLKRDMLKKQHKSFRRKLEEQIYEEMFGKVKEEK